MIMPARRSGDQLNLEWNLDLEKSVMKFPVRSSAERTFFVPVGLAGGEIGTIKSPIF